LRLYAKAQVGLPVPDLFFPEFSNIFWKAARRLSHFPTGPLIQPAIQIARAYDRAVYDCVYVALAVEPNTHLVTADQKLANSVPGMPVTWLGLI